MGSEIDAKASSGRNLGLGEKRQSVCSNRDSGIDALEYNNLSDFHSIASAADHKREINLLAVNVAGNYFKRNKNEYLSGKKGYKPGVPSKLGPGDSQGDWPGGSGEIDTLAKSVKIDSRRSTGQGQKMTKKTGKKTGKKKLVSKKTVVGGGK